MSAACPPDSAEPTPKRARVDEIGNWTSSDRIGIGSSNRERRPHYYLLVVMEKLCARIFLFQMQLTSPLSASALQLSQCRCDLLLIASQKALFLRSSRNDSPGHFVHQGWLVVVSKLSGGWCVTFLDIHTRRLLWFARDKSYRIGPLDVSTKFIRSKAEVVVGRIEQQKC